MAADPTSPQSSAVDLSLEPLLEVSLTQPDRLVEPDAWVGHIPFAFWIVAAHRPRMLVELGTHSGNSYGAFCQSVAMLGLNTACYAVDTWAGDPQAGFYGEDVYDDLRRYHDPRYAAFSRLVRSTFDDAVVHFADGSIDLLHIDGYHVYDAVKHDFETWQPKLSSRGLVLLHDINVRERDFGAWRLWQELSETRAGFDFLHSHGLGVIAVGDEIPERVRALLTTSAPHAAGLRQWFACRGQSLLDRLASSRARQTARNRDETAAALQMATQRCGQLEEALRHVTTERDDGQAELQRLRDACSDLEGNCAELSRTLEQAAGEQSSALAQVQKLAHDQTLLIETRTFLQRQLAKERRRRQRLRNSLSWRATKPLRLVGSAITSVLGSKRKRKKGNAQPKAPAAPPAPQPVPAPAEPTFVRLADANPLRDPVARVVAFYLPQFHPIPENDRWWGKGFTEWTNVSRARPQFEGHYQPRLPGELGFYDLRLVEVQQRQVELAKLYGISAFCFYFYWFSGKRLLERPVDQWLARPELDLEFCLCWANENWTRRWDGLDSEILIAQNHSPEDDLAFIADVAPYLRDRRYLRVGGRPVLLVYRPGLLPDPRATTERWRQWCRTNGIGEIFLVYTLAFDTQTPAELGFDAAVEFPPIRSELPVLASDEMPLVGAEFSGCVADGSVLVKRSFAYAEPSHQLIRGLCPSWDNTARRGAAAYVLAKSSPRLFRDWVENAAIDTATRFPEWGDRLVMVNAWNEWAEGAYLEPDRRHGYGYLEAMRQGLRLAGRRRAPYTASEPSLAVILHAYYPDVLPEILPQLRAMELPVKVFASCPDEHRLVVERILVDAGFHEIVVDSVANRGRDIWPFLETLARLDEAGERLLLKIHTKKSDHRPDGEAWRRELYHGLLHPRALRAAVDGLQSDRGFGIVAPAGHVLSLREYLGSNLGQVEQLWDRLGVAPLDRGECIFVAGSMFYARVDALRPLIKLGLSAGDFEPELGQVDGTMAHGVERVMQQAALVAGFRVGEIVDGEGEIREAVARLADYPYAARAA